MAGEERQTGTRDEHYDLISALYHLLEGASTCEQYLRDAEASGDQELVQFFRDWQEEQRHLAERAKNLLGSRMASPRASTGRAGAKKGAGAMREVKAPINASIQSGGNASDDIVDEQSKESFPASDAPAKY